MRWITFCLIIKTRILLMMILRAFLIWLISIVRIVSTSLRNLRSSQPMLWKNLIKTQTRSLCRLLGGSVRWVEHWVRWMVRLSRSWAPHNLWSSIATIECGRSNKTNSSIRKLTIGKLKSKRMKTVVLSSRGLRVFIKMTKLARASTYRIKRHLPA